MRISDWSSDVCSSDLPERLLEKYPETKGRAILPGYVGIRYWPGGEPKGYRWLSAPISIAIDSRYRGIVKDIRDARLALRGRAERLSAISFCNPQRSRCSSRSRSRSEEHTSELQSLMRNSYAVFCLKK